MFLHLEDSFNDGIDAAMAVEGLPIGIGDGLAEHGGLRLGLCDTPAAPGCGHTLGAVQDVLLPCTRG